MSDNIIDNIAYAILGTCKSLNEVCEEYGITEDDLTMEQFYRLDDITLECCVCNWWSETSEFNDEYRQICDDCRGDVDDEE